MKNLDMRYYHSGGKAPRWLINNVRVSREVFDNLNQAAHCKECFLVWISEKTGRIVSSHVARVPEWAIKEEELI